MTHELKTWDEFMMDIATGKKPFELRLNDRDFQEGDSLLLQGYDKLVRGYTGKVIEADVTYILKDWEYGLQKGYVIMGIKVKNYNF